MAKDHLPFVIDSRTSRIAIIGAGAAGLATARAFKLAGYQIQVYEASNDVGGTWAYNPKSAETSSLYASLRCNIPHAIMCYVDHPFPSHVPSFAPHREVFAYLKRFADHYNLRDHILFSTRVRDVRKVILNDNHSMWRIRVDGFEDAFFNAVIVCTGHYTVPSPWVVPGVDQFIKSHRTITHSHTYKVPDPYAGSRVVVIGAGPSGVDISLELSRNANVVFLSHSRDTPVFGDHPKNNLKEVVRVRRLYQDGRVELVNGTFLHDIDHIIACTGYLYQYPFLSQGEAGVKIHSDNRSVRGLLLHCIAKNDYTLAFMGLLSHIIPFPLFEDQAYFLTALYSGKISPEKMLQIHRDTSEVDEADRQVDKYYHYFGDAQWEYRRQLASISGRPLVTQSCIEVTRDSSAARRYDPYMYREREYCVLGPGPNEWRVTLEEVDVTGKDDPGSPRATISVGTDQICEPIVR